MDREAARQLRPVAGGLAVIVAGLHLLHPTHGGPPLRAFVRIGRVTDPRPPLFVLAGFALLFGVALGVQGLDDRWTYAGGIAVVVALLLGFAGWHTVLGHGGFWPGRESLPHPDRNAALLILDHLTGDPYLLLSKAAEVGLLGCLVALFRAADDSRADADVAEASGTDADPS
jgi:hypothetical protein